MSVNEGNEDMSVDGRNVCEWRRYSLMKEMNIGERDKCEWRRWVMMEEKSVDERDECEDIYIEKWERKFIVFTYDLWIKNNELFVIKMYGFKHIN